MRAPQGRRHACRERVPESSEALMIDLARRLAAVPDAALRVAYVGSTLSSLHPTHATDVLLVAQARADTRDPLATSLWLASATSLLAAERDALRRTIAAHAEARDAFGLVAALVDLPDERLSMDEEDEQRVPDYGSDRPLTLGERKSLARKPRRAMLGRIAQDPHPDVIRQLLGNPALTEADVIAMVARRPVPRATLLEVAASARWTERPRVRLALVRNPYTPTHVAVSYVRGLALQELREIVDASELPSVVRSVARTLLGEPIAGPTLH